MEKKFNAPVDKVFGLLTDPKWLEARCLALGELSRELQDEEVRRRLQRSQ